MSDMKHQTPVNLKFTSSPCVTEGAPDSGQWYDSFPCDERAVPCLQGRRRKISKQKAWASVFLILAVLAVLVSCMRPVRVRRSIAAAGRKLAGKGNEEDLERSAILELCLDLQEETGVITQHAALLPGPEEAIPVILGSLLKPSDVGAPHQIEPPSHASVESAWPHPISEAGPTNEEAAGGGDGEEVQAWYDSVQTAEADVPPHVGDGGVAAPSTAPLQWLSETPLQPSILQISSTAGSPLPSSTVTASGRKRGITESAGGGPSAPAEQTDEQGEPQQPQAKKHTSGWKRRASSSSPVAFPPVQEHPEEAAGEDSEDPFFGAVPTLSNAWSPEPLEYMKTAGSGSEDEHTYTSPAQTTSYSLQTPEVHLSPSDGPLFTGLEWLTSTSPASMGSPLPSTSQTLELPCEAPPEEPLPGPSRPAVAESSPPTPPPSGDNESFTQNSLSTDPNADTDNQSDLASHPFYRLPVLLPGPIYRVFDARRAFTDALTRPRSFNSLAIIRSVLLRPTIAPHDAMFLVGYSEMLAGRLYHDLQMPLKGVKMNRIVEHLGRAFFCLDALISVIQLVGEPMDAQSWWPRLANVIPQYASTDLKKFGARPAAVYNAKLVRRLSDALQHLKSGQRLGAQQTIELKRELLSKALATQDFRDKKWDPWRTDDEKSRNLVRP